MYKRQDWTRARGNLSPDHLLSEDDEEMGSNNDEDPKDPAYSPSESLMDSDEDTGEIGYRDQGDSVMESDEKPTTPPPRRYPTRQRGFKRSLLELLNEPDYYVSPYNHPKSPHRKNPRSSQ